ncbi:MAG: condensation domain-containing protein [Verrucomicrobiota bacterium]
MDNLNAFPDSGPPLPDAETSLLPPAHRHPPSRRLGALEHLIWVLDQGAPMHFSLTAEIAGATTASQWRAALDHIQARHPILSTKIEEAADGKPHFRRKRAAPIPLRVVLGDPASSWQEQVLAELAEPIDASRAPLVRAAVTLGLDGAAVTLTAHHGVADGLSVAYLLRDLLQVVAGAPPPLLPLSRSQDEMLGLLVPTPGSCDFEPSPAPTYRAPTAQASQVTGLRLPAPLAQRLRDRARREQASLHGALCAALTLAARQTVPAWQDIPFRIFSPVEIRPLAGAGEGCGVYLLAKVSSLAQGEDMFWNLARQVKRDILEARTRPSVHAGLAALQARVCAGVDLAGCAGVHEGDLCPRGGTHQSRCAALRAANRPAADQGDLGAGATAGTAGRAHPRRRHGGRHALPHLHRGADPPRAAGGDARRAGGGRALGRFHLSRP